jgi:hypothetical protein
MSSRIPHQVDQAGGATVTDAQTPLQSRRVPVL